MDFRYGRDLGIVAFLGGIALFAVGCAGPMSPFGALEGWKTDSASSPGNLSSRAGDPGSPHLRFLPGRQKWHGTTTFRVVIEEPLGLLPESEFRLYYNGHDVTRRFLARADSTFTDRDHRTLKISFPRMRLIADRENRIVARYRRKDGQRWLSAEYGPPRCSAFDQEGELKGVEEFNPSAALIWIINRQAAANGLNPRLVAGLIAQESGFDPLAVSSRRALGLTQVTPIADEEVAKSFPAWPRYLGMEEIPVPLLRMMVLRGTINGANDWRLDPRLSIQGGVAYLLYLAGYWSRDEKRALLRQGPGDGVQAVSEAILASYHSGAARVSMAMTARGADYLRDDSLDEARRYVRRVVSYCDHIAGDQGAE